MGIAMGMHASASGLTAQRLRLDVIANNIANVNTTRSGDGGPYQKQAVTFMPRPAEFGDYLPPILQRNQPPSAGRGVRVVDIIEDESDPKLVYDPGHPDADEEGYVAYPNISIAHEMVDLIDATRAYQANVTAIGAGREMGQAALDILT
jgi:flagellar basal-body rod protein FlgC